MGESSKIKRKIQSVRKKLADRRNRAKYTKASQKRTLGKKLSFGIITVVVITILIAIILADVFLPKYYESVKRKSIVEVYETLAEVEDGDSSFENDESLAALNDVCEIMGATLIVLDSSGSELYQYGNTSILASRWKDILFNTELNHTILEENDNYTLQYATDRLNDEKYYEIYGVLSKGSYFVARMSVESFDESISISSIFFLVLTLIALAVIIILIIIITNRYTAPLLELAEISKRMSRLDFDARYEGNHDGEIGILSDSMNEMSETLEKTITDLKNANDKLNKDIKEKEQIDEMRKDFIASVSHDLKTPIALIQGYAEGLQEGIMENPEDANYYCDVIVDEAKKMNKMVRNLLALNSIESGGQPLSIERFDINELILGILDSYRLRAEKDGAKVDFENRGPLYVWADEFQIEEVLTNYMSNAFNHLSGEKTIKIESETVGDKVRVSVFNTGRNIPAESIEHIWDKFYKVDKARTRAYGGNGIGLSIVKAIMDRHNGSYGVVNYQNGVEFWIMLDSGKPAAYIESSQL